MRKHYSKVLKEHFHKSLLQTRDFNGITQEEMAAKLCMSVRSYCSLENGESSCSALTLVLFLLFTCKNPDQFLEDLHYALEDKTSIVA